MFVPGALGSGGDGYGAEEAEINHVAGGELGRSSREGRCGCQFR